MCRYRWLVHILDIPTVPYIIFENYALTSPPLQLSALCNLSFDQGKARLSVG